MAAGTNSLYSTLGAQPALGRLPVAADEDRVAVISDAPLALVVRRRSLRGRTQLRDGGREPDHRRRHAAGVPVPERRRALVGRGPRYAPRACSPDGSATTSWAGGARAPTARPSTAELTALARRLPERFGGSAGYARLIERHHAVVRPLLDELLGPAARSPWILFAAAAIVLLIACAQRGEPFSWFASKRAHRDLAVRRAIGASRAQLVRLQMAEALVAALMGGALAVGLAGLSLPVLLRAAPAGVPRLAEVSLGPQTLLFTLLAALPLRRPCAGQRRRWRGASPNLSRLREGGRGSTRRRRLGRDGLVAAQTAMALVLLIGAGLLMRSFLALRSVDPGYDTRDVFTFQFAPEQPALKDGPSWARFHLDFLDRLAALPGRDFGGDRRKRTPGRRHARRSLPQRGHARRPRRRPAPQPGPSRPATTSGRWPIDVLDGRPFETADHLSVHGNVVISRSAAKLLFPGQRAVGRRLQQQGARPRCTPSWASSKT